MRQNKVKLQTIYWVLLMFVLSAVIVLLSAGAVHAQAPEPTSGTESAAGSFPWLALGLFIVMAVLLTKFRSHPSYPKKATGNCCAPVVDGNDSPFRIILDDDPASTKE